MLHELAAPDAQKQILGGPLKRNLRASVLEHCVQNPG